MMSTCEISTAVNRGQQPQAITPKQVELVEKTWKVVEDSVGLLNAGIELFKKIFKIAPSTQQMFRKFHDVPFEELPENEHFRHHALQVTETIALGVSSLDDMEGLICVLKELGAAHSSHGLNDEYFDVVGQALLATLEGGLGEEFTPEVKEAYVTFYGIVTKTMKEGLNEAYALSED